MISSSPGIEALKAEVGPGRCIICDEKIKTKPVGQQHRYVCGDRECKRTYQRIYRVDRSAKRGRKMRNN